ncbi:nicotinate-nucleotide--dimethylbenzimidazole phosphoribosyltransferase [Streptomyces fructofermentans]|uniref:nicotinate-nucleotide--dimethylbenzimidazole phosphoribosyltransferase n=1 Tax=Streptomyces fructofermentans TaxID=152141 RepID=UPI00379C3BCC
MTDTGQVPGEGLPENAGMVEQPGVPAPGAYTYLSETTAEDDDLLLLPGAQGAWGNEVAPPAPAPVVEAVHEPGPHETAGRDSGAVDLSAVRMSTPAPQPPVARRPLHLGPPTPDGAGSPVRSLADRGPAGAPVHPGSVRHTAPPVAGPEYLDVPQEVAPQGASPWGAQARTQVAPPAVAQVAMAGAAAETVFPQGAGAHADGPEQSFDTADAPLTGEEDLAAQQAPAEPAVPARQTADPAAEGPAAYGQASPEEPARAAEPVYASPYPEQAGTPEPAAAPEPVPVQDYAQAPLLADGSLFPQAPGEFGTPGEFRAPEEFPAPDGPRAPEALPVPEGAQAVPEFPQGPHPDAVPVEPSAAMPEHPSNGAGLPAPEPPQAADEAHAAHPVHAAGDEQQFQDPSAPFAGGADEAPADVTQTPEDAAGALAAPAAPVVEQAVPAEDPATAAGPAGPEAPGIHAEPEPDVTGAPAEEPAAVAAVLHGDEPHTPADLHAAGAPGDRAEQPVGQFVAVDGTVPTGPRLAPTPPHAMALPPLPRTPADGTPGQEADPVAVAAEPSPEEEPLLVLPAPREPEQAPGAEAVPVPEAPAEEQIDAQQAEDLDTRAAEQEESTVAVAETRESTGPAAPGYDEAERAAVLRVMRERRDIRNGFRSDPIPHDVLLRVLEAAHTAPSVGHSQPWDFVVIRSAETRRTMHELATRQREAYAKSLPKGRAKQFKELKIEAILDTPVNIVVTADPTRGGRHTLGRHTQPQMAPYSSALAVENLWLAARAEGLGVGWVSFFDEREMVRELGLPDHLEVVAYLCVGYVDEFPEEPELMQAGWSKRRPLSWVVHEETYGRRALPGEEPHDLLAETVANIRPLDAKALGEAWERQKRMTKPAGALGMLEIISAQLSGLSRMCPPPIPEPAAVAIFAGDHGVHAQGVTPWPQEVTGQMVANILGGGAVCNAFAGQVGAEVCVVDVGVASDLPATPGLLPRKVRAGTADMTTGPALTREEVKAAIEVGVETARDLVAAGNKALITGEMGIANTTASAALISVYTDSDPAEVTGRGTGINDETLARKTEVVRRALELHRPDPADPIGVLAAIGGLEHAALVGLLLGGASLRTPVILDGVSAGAAALVARAIAPEVLAACIAGHRSAEPGHVAALNKLGLRPLVDLDLRLGEGTGALLALPVVQSAARAMHEVATFDSAGVTEK